MDGPKDSQPLNLARIVHRLMTSPRGWAKDSLCEELGIKDRTYRKYRRNLQTLFEGWFQDGESRLVEVVEGERRFLRLKESKAPDGEVMSLILRLSVLQFSSQLFGFLGDDEMGTSLSDLKQAAGYENRRRFPQTFSRVMANLDRLFFYLPDAAKDYADQEAKLRVVIQSLVYQRALRFRYTSANKPGADHEVEPLTLALYRGGLHLLARYKGTERTYNFVVDRISDPESLDAYFAYPDPSEYEPKTLYEGSFGIFLKREARQLDVELLFADVKWLKLYVREREWQPGQTFKDLGDGRLRLSFQVTNLVEVTPWVLQFGGEVEVLGPQELREAVARARG